MYSDTRTFSGGISWEGTVIGKPGDWLMIGIDGEKYICDDTIFKKTYNLKENESK